ncbi:YkvA family protein [Thalassospira alkalitolerans]|uniref:DUF1232 domain-containing protein n=1 Tax=Thalassospira alkalitolerans TaxID=1293890 RepID=A0A1Y2LHT5_9PROT|nr:DUF1232 domain-containing protein [Thalassospira alkalitolerans]OSQ49593.1 hypothetical protein TALK_04495 [Thalassospira alkalitolerans]|tara:strand:- start:41037 stop:41405 length:369 start_codon:yes stop_codon:yes gene_type:complete
MAKASVWAIIPRLLSSLFRSDVPLRSKALLLLGLVYLISPIDLVPDVIVGIGWIDDLIIVPLLGWLSFRSLPEATQDNMVRDEPVIDAAKPVSRKWLYLVIVIAVIVAIVMLTGPDGRMFRN